MSRRVRLQIVWLAIACVPAVVFAQAEVRPAREFTAFRGTWKIDESTGRGHIAGLPIAHTLLIATSPEELRLTKDGGEPEHYRLDGVEIRAFGTERSVVLVGDALAVTTRRTRRDRGYAFTNVITDAYTVNGDELTVERQLSVVVATLMLRDGRVTDESAAGHFAELENPNNSRQTIVYRRSR
jgi:hypothetical protein